MKANWETAKLFFSKAQQKLSHNLAISLLGICPRMMKMYSHMKSRIQIFRAALSIYNQKE
jgi:transposase